MDKGRILLVAAACGWSLSGVIIKSSSLDGLSIAWARSAVAALFLLPWAWHRRQPIDKGTFFIALAYMGTVTLLVLATKATTAANAIVLQYIAPAVVFVLGIPLLREYPKKAEWFALGFSMFGVGVIFVGAPAGQWPGIVLGVGSGIMFGLLIVGLRRYRDKDPYWTIFLNNAVVGLVLLPFVEWPGGDTAGFEGALMAVLGIVQLGLPYVLFFKAVKLVVAREAALISLLEPLLNPVWVALVVGEIPNTATQVGGGIVLIGVLLPYLYRRRG